MYHDITRSRAMARLARYCRENDKIARKMEIDQGQQLDTAATQQAVWQSGSRQSG